MIYTGNYKNCKGDKCVSISGDKGKGANFTGQSYAKLAPKYNFWKIWHNNIGIISEEENTRYYIHEYYNNVLKKLSPKEVYEKLDGCILLCYEEENIFCHRYIVAYWLEITLGIKVDEVRMLDNGTLIKLAKPEYLRKMLLEEMNK